MRKPEKDSSWKRLAKMRFICKCFMVGSQVEAKFWKRTESQNSLEAVAGEERVRSLMVAGTRTPYSHSTVHIVGSQKMFLNE